METKDLIASTLLLIATCGGVVAATLSYYARAALFVALVVGAVFVDKMGVEFMSLYWYRGTTRGLELTLLDAIAFSVLAGSLLAPRHPYPRLFWPAGVGLMALFWVYCFFQVLASTPMLTGMFELLKMARGMLVVAAAAAFVRTQRELAVLAFALAGTLGIEGLVAFKQRYYNIMDRAHGTIEHANSLSMYICMVTPVVLAAALSDFPRWLRWWCGAGVVAGAVGVLLTASRAGIPIFLAVVGGMALWGVSFRITWQKIAIGAASVAFFGVLVYGSWDTLYTRYTQATLQSEYFDQRTEGRGVYLRWAGEIMHDHPHGVGLNNWSYYVSREYGPRHGYRYEDYRDFSSAPQAGESPGFYAAPAHNLFALTAGEVGIGGAIIFALLWLRWFQLGAMFLWRKLEDPMHRMGAGVFFGTAGIFLQSMTEWTYRQTALFFTFSVLLGVLASLTWGRRNLAPTQAAAAVRVRDEEYVLGPTAGAERW